MIKYVVKRLLTMIPTLAGASLIVFALIHLLPGDPIITMFGQQPNPALIEYLRHQYGFDRPLYVQYIDWIWNILHGNFGKSIRYGTPILDLIMERLPATLWLILFAMIVSLSVSIPLSVISASRPGSATDYAGTIFVLIGISAPSFWLGLMLILIFTGYLRILPPYGFVSPLESIGQFLAHLALPSVTLGLLMGGTVARMARPTMAEVLKTDYVKFVRSKGLSQRAVLYKHVLKNALIPVVTIVGLQMGYLLAGSVVIEQVFGWPGMGRLLLQAIYTRDYFLIQGALLFYSGLFMLVNLATDLLYAYIDPRIHYE